MAWLSGWEYRIAIDIDSSKIDSTLSNFTVLLYLSSSSGIDNTDVTAVFDEVGANSKKIAVTTSNGTTECYVEIEDWNNGDEEAWIWAKIPSISNSSDTTIYLYYDNTHADNTTYVGDIDSTPGHNAWSGLNAVYHFAEAGTATRLDSTSNNNNIIPQNYDGNEDVDAKIARGDDLDGGDDYLTTSGDAYGTTHTFSFWANADQLLSGGHAILGVDLNWYAFLWLPSFIGYRSSVASGASVSYSGSTHTWTHFGLRRTGTTVRFYVNGSQQGTDQTLSANDAVTINFVGKENNRPAVSQYHFDGTLDEMKLSTSDLGSSWIKAEFNTGNDSLVTFGTQQVNSSSSSTSLSSSSSSTSLSSSSSSTSLSSSSSSTSQSSSSSSTSLSSSSSSTSLSSSSSSTSLSSSSSSTSDSSLSDSSTSDSSSSSSSSEGYSVSSGSSSTSSLGLSESTSSSSSLSSYSSENDGWLPGWGKRVRMVIDGSKIDNGLFGFPVLVHLSKSSGINNADVTEIFEEIGASSKKIAVTTWDGVTECYIEVEKWNVYDPDESSSSSEDFIGEAWLWVRVPWVPPEDTILFLYYDGDHADNDAYVGDVNSIVAEKVWENEYKGVWHISEGGVGTRYDSTVNSNDGTPEGYVGNEAVNNGQIDGADALDNPITKEGINVGTDGSLNIADALTVSAWLYHNVDVLSTSSSSSSSTSLSSSSSTSESSTSSYSSGAFDVRYFAYGFTPDDYNGCYEFEDYFNGMPRYVNDNNRPLWFNGTRYQIHVWFYAGSSPLDPTNGGDAYTSIGEPTYLAGFVKEGCSSSSSTSLSSSSSSTSESSSSSSTSLSSSSSSTSLSSSSSSTSESSSSSSTSLSSSSSSTSLSSSSSSTSESSSSSSTSLSSSSSTSQSSSSSSTSESSSSSSTSQSSSSSSTSQSSSSSSTSESSSSSSTSQSSSSSSTSESSSSSSTSQSSSSSSTSQSSSSSSTSQSSSSSSTTLSSSSSSTSQSSSSSSTSLSSSSSSTSLSSSSSSTSQSSSSSSTSQSSSSSSTSLSSSSSSTSESSSSSSSSGPAGIGKMRIEGAYNPFKVG